MTEVGQKHGFGTVAELCFDEVQFSNCLTEADTERFE